MAEKVEKKPAAGPRRQARRQSQALVTRARGQVEGLVAERTGLAADRLEALAAALRSTASRLEEQQVGPLAEVAGSAAERVDRASGYLRERDLEGLLEDVERFARRRPELFLGATFLAGLLLARFVKSSGERRAAAPARRPARTA